MNLELPLDGTNRSDLRVLSEAVFGGASTLELLLAFGLHDELYVGQLAELAGAYESYASTFVRRLERAGLVEQSPQPPGMRRKYYRRRDSALWTGLVEWAEETLSSTPARVTSLPTLTADQQRK